MRGCFAFATAKAQIQNQQTPRPTNCPTRLRRKRDFHFRIGRLSQLCQDHRFTRDCCRRGFCSPGPRRQTREAIGAADRRVKLAARYRAGRLGRISARGDADRDKFHIEGIAGSPGAAQPGRNPCVGCVGRRGLEGRQCDRVCSNYSPPQSNVSGLDIAAAIVGNDAKECKGKFASARNSELLDSEVVFRGMSSCEDSEHSAIAEYFIFPRKAGGFIMFSVLTPTNISGQQKQGPEREEVNAGFRKAAYVSLGH